MTDERTLPDAKRKLEDAIAALIDPRPQEHNNRVVWIGSIYSELRDAIHGHKASSTRQPSEPQPPLWIDGIDLANDIDNTVRGWERRGAGPRHPTVNRLTAIVMRTWRPQDTGTITDMATAVGGWVHRYRTLTEPKPKHLPSPCPACGKRHVYRDSAGEQVRQPALQITTAGCECQACRARWTPSQFVFLARVLGYRLPQELADA